MQTCEPDNALQIPRDMTGLRFGRLAVVGRSDKRDREGKRKFWLCHCDCGEERHLSKYVLIYGQYKSCGCLKRDRQTKHGLSHTRAYSIRKMILQRCTNKRLKDYPHYGGRGITVCPEWTRSFEIFLRDMGNPPERAEIDRINNDGNYEPGNCRWATRKENNRNKRNNHLVEFNGLTLTIAEWAERTGYEPHTIRFRLKAGWDPARALTTPPRKKD